VAKREAHITASPTEISEVVLRFIEGENEGVEIRINPPRELYVGRSEECDIFLGEKKISRKHCQLKVATDGVQLTDLKSTNGTYVNSKKIDEVEIHHDDKIRIGTSLVQVSLTTGRVMPKPEPPKPEKESMVLEEDEISAGTMTEEPEPRMPITPVAEDPDMDIDDEPSGAVEISDEEAFFEENSPVKKDDSRRISIPKAKPLSGNLSAMGLADLLQNLAQNQKSGILSIQAKATGKIWVLKGQVVGAEVGSASGAKALYRMLGWNEGSFELLTLPPEFSESGVKNPITTSVETLLMEGFRQFDELEKIRKGLPDMKAQLKMKPKFTAPLSKLHPRVLDVLQVILNEGEMQKVLDASSLSDLETSKVIFYLLKKEYIVAN
jgi:pSer/pThr/pTyr-binding forkhead associated (FHA) protein